MKVTIPIGLLFIVAALAYLLGTESGREQRDVVLVKLGRKEPDAGGGGADALA